MRHLIVRHAHAGSRGSTGGDDLLRPLSRKGERQSAGVAKLLAERSVTEVRSSRAVRCVDTVQPLADMLGLEVVTTRHLLEGADPIETLAWLCAREVPIVGSSHGDVIGGLMMLLAGSGVPIEGELGWPKAGTWDIRVKKGAVVDARFLPPPEG